MGALAMLNTLRVDMVRKRYPKGAVNRVSEAFWALEGEIHDMREHIKALEEECDKWVRLAKDARLKELMEDES